MSLLTPFWILDALTLASIIALCIYAYFSHNANYWRKLGVRQASLRSPLGHGASLTLARVTPDEFIDELYNGAKGENMAGFHIFGTPYLMLRDPELIKHVFVKDFNNFANKMLTGDDRDVLGKTSLFLTRNPPWRHIRHKLTPIFTSGKLKKMLDVMMEVCRDFENYLDDLKIDERDGKELEVKEICAKLTTDIIGITAYGIKFNSLTDPNAECRKIGRDMFRDTYKRYLQMLAMFFIPVLRPLTNPQFFDAAGSKFLTSTFWHVIDERTKSGAKRNDLIDLLIEMKKKQEMDEFDEFKLEGDALVAQAAIFFTGGFETSSTTMSFALYEIAKQPEIQKKLRDELLESFAKSGGKITYEMVTALPYLNQVVHESLRMYPIIPWLDRIPDADYTFPGTNVTVKKDTPVILPMRALQMDPKYFPNPTRFDPERFSDENKDDIVPYTFFPFGEGPRNCIGSRLGLIQVKLGLIHFLRQYEISPCERTPMPIKIDKLNVFIHSEGGLYLNFKKLACAA